MRIVDLHRYYFNLSVLFILFLASISQSVLAQEHICKEQLDSTFNWFRNNPPNSSNIQSRREKTVLLDKLGWQVSPETWKLYNSSTQDSVLTMKLESQYPILYYLRHAFKKSVSEIKSSQIDKGVIVWKLYNMGYVIKTKDVCFAIDLVTPFFNELVDVIDFTVVSHVHNDHFNRNFIQALTAAGKAVYSPFYHEGTVISSDTLLNFKELEVRFTMNKQGDLPVIVSEINCGPSADYYTIYDIADARILEKLQPSRHINLFILHIANGLNIFDAVKKINPDMTLYDHIMEFGHPVDRYRWSYGFTYDKTEQMDPASNHILTWGERIESGLGKKISWSEKGVIEKN